MCDKFNLFPTSNFAQVLERSSEMKGIILVHDKLSEADELKIRAKYPADAVRLVGALWFYLSIYFSYELPLECFELEA
jgi:hypothetical protein